MRTAGRGEAGREATVVVAVTRKITGDLWVVSIQSARGSRSTTNSDFIDFAPPASFSFAPPPASPPHVAAIPDDPTGDDAYARRLALSGLAVPPPSPPEYNQAPPPPQEPVARYEPPTQEPPVQPGITPQATTAPYSPPTQNPTTEDQDIEMDIDSSEEEYVPPPISTPDTPEQTEPARSNRPGQADFAARLMSKYGWTKGSGLGADSSGITSALRVKIEKRRKKPDAEGGGFAEPGGRGKIIGGAPAKKKKEDAGSDDNKISAVIALDHMLDSIADLEGEIESGELKQDIGQECGDKYGNVEKISIDVGDRRVFIKFTNAVSALRVSFLFFFFLLVFLLPLVVVFLVWLLSER